jgi:hypothetical protein
MFMLYNGNVKSAQRLLAQSRVDATGFCSWNCLRSAAPTPPAHTRASRTCARVHVAAALVPAGAPDAPAGMPAAAALRTRRMMSAKSARCVRVRT